MRELGGHRDGVVKRRAGAIVEVDLEVCGPELLAALGQRPGALQLGATSLPRAHPRGVRVGGVEGVLRSWSARATAMPREVMPSNR